MWQFASFNWVPFLLVCFPLQFPSLLNNIIKEKCFKLLKDRILLLYNFHKKIMELIVFLSVISLLMQV